MIMLPSNLVYDGKPKNAIVTTNVSEATRKIEYRPIGTEPWTATAKFM